MQLFRNFDMCLTTVSCTSIALIVTLLPSVMCVTPRVNFFLSRALWKEPTLDFSNDETVNQASFASPPVSSPPTESSALETNFYLTPNFTSLLASDDTRHPLAALDEKTFFELVSASSNLSLPLNSDKFLWFTDNDHYKPNLENSESMKNEVAVSAKLLKSVSICDKTLAFTDFVKEDETDIKTLIRCELYDLEKNPERAYAEVQKSGLQLQNIGFAAMRDIINSCRQIAEIGPEIASPIGITDDTLPSSVNGTDSSKTTLWTFWRALVPGTKWCGLGDSAKNYHDLGKRKDIDICRAHDHCPIRLKALRTGYGLLNLSLYTKSHCDCDEDFSTCLRQTNTKFSEMLGNFYFNIMRMQCIKSDKPLTCVEIMKSSNGKEECVRYEEDKNSTKMVFTQPEISY